MKASISSLTRSRSKRKIYSDFAVTTKPIQNEKVNPVKVLSFYFAYTKIKTAKIAKFKDKNFKAIKFCAVI